MPGVRLIETVEINQLFIEMPEKVIAGLEADGVGLGRREEGVRMVTAWSTSSEEVDHVVGRAVPRGWRPPWGRLTGTPALLFLARAGTSGR